MSALCRAKCLVLAALVLGLATPAQAELRVSDLEVYLNDNEITVRVVVLGAIPDTFMEGIQSGMPAHVRTVIELWQYNRLRPDRRLYRTIVERALTYNVVTREYRVSTLRGIEDHGQYVTRDLHDAQRVLSEARGVKLKPEVNLEPRDVIYVRVRAFTALNGENSFFARMAGTAEETSRQSEYRTIARVQ